MSHRVRGVLVSGWPARSLAVALRSMLERAGLPDGPHRARLEALLADLEAEVADWEAACSSSSAQGPSEQAVSSSGDDDEIGTTEAAEMLRVSRQRVAQLCAVGELPSRKVAGRRLVDRAAVLELVEERNHDTESA